VRRDTPRLVSGPIKIVAALVHPMGPDEGKENVTLGPGMATTIVLPRHSVQLPNKGGEIRLVDRAGSTTHFPAGLS
jgi:poly(U)-specific endoribonuclease